MWASTHRILVSSITVFQIAILLSDSQSSISQVCWSCRSMFILFSLREEWLILLSVLFFSSGNRQQPGINAKRTEGPLWISHLLLRFSPNHPSSGLKKDVKNTSSSVESLQQRGEKLRYHGTGQFILTPAYQDGSRLMSVCLGCYPPV